MAGLLSGEAAQLSSHPGHAETRLPVMLAAGGDAMRANAKQVEIDSGEWRG